MEIKEAFLRAALCDLMLSVADDEKISDGLGGDRGYFQAPIRSFLKIVAVWSGRHGFVTSKAAREAEEKGDYSKFPTGKLVFNDFFLPLSYGDQGRADKRRAFHASITDEESEKADELVDAAMEWGKGAFVDEKEENLSDYGHNMKLLLAADYVRIVDVGYVASVIPGYKRATAPKAVKLAGKSHLGKVGEKITVPVTVREVRDWAGQYGLTHITTFEDYDGNVLVWFAPEKIAPMNVGAYKVMVATVKRHDERNGTKQTIVTYPKFS